MELFVHTHGNEHPEIIEIEGTALVRELLIEEEPDGRIWVEEADEEISLDITLESAGIRPHHHVHRGRCHRVQVVVRFNGHRFEHPYGPSTIIKAVKGWAFGPDAAGFSPEDAAKHVLAVPGADHFLEDGVHVGSLANPGKCEVVLDLLPRSRFAG
jgi:hypothetical protein